MTLFGSDLSKVEKRILENSAKTKKVFSEETNLIELGLKLMWDSTNITQKARKDFAENPNLVANTNLFGRNRQLLTNAYSCMLFATYGTQLVNLRVVLENNNLMRLFNFSHRQAYSWLDKDKQNEFSAKIQKRYKKCKARKHLSPSSVLRKIHKKTGHDKAKINTAKIYGQLCDYTHPNFLGWQELMGMQGSNEILLDLPVFVGENTDNSLKVMLYLILYSFKTFVETFNLYMDVYTADQLTQWQEKYGKIMPKYMGK
jgi:hypothetical protein